MQKKIKLLLAFVVMLVQLAGFVCDLHSDSSHSEESSGVHLGSEPESHHVDCITQPEIAALLFTGTGMKVDRVQQADAFIASPAYFPIAAAHTVPPWNWHSDPSISSSLRSVSPILRI